MERDLRLGQQQTQRLILRPELRQGLAVLQLSIPELVEYIDTALEENPCLEVDDEERDGADAEADREDEWDRTPEDPVDPGLPGEVSQAVQREIASRDAGTLEDYLLEQLRLSSVEPALHRVAEYLIGNLNEDGYLEIEPGDAARELGVKDQLVRAGLNLMQSFRPAGVGARNLPECLVLQLHRKGYDDPLFQTLIAEHLDALASGQYERVAKALGLKVNEIAEAFAIIRSLNPRPGLSHAGGDGVRYLVPDVFVEKVGGEFIVLVNETYLPHLTVSRTYQAMLASTKDPEAQSFLAAKVKAARELLRNIDRRRLTLYRVMTQIVAEQRRFFEDGAAYLKPLTLKEVADALGIHESTVSRAVADKYAQTPRGIFSLKYFLASGPSDTAAEAVKRKIREMIEREDPERPYSDQQMASVFSGQGLVISRRTVAKYRDEMGVLPARQRRRRGYKVFLER